MATPFIHHTFHLDQLQGQSRVSILEDKIYHNQIDLYDMQTIKAESFTCTLEYLPNPPD